MFLLIKPFHTGGATSPIAAVMQSWPTAPFLRVSMMSMSMATWQLGVTPKENHYYEKTERLLQVL
jgi:hypothetical protein